MLPLDAHRRARLDALQAEDGWLNLCDRVEITGDSLTVGAASDNDLVLSRGPAHLGRLLRQTGGFAFEPPEGPLQVFQPRPDTPPQTRVPPFLLEIHTVDDQPALRVRDLTLPRTAALRYFPTAPDWIVRADWTELSQPSAQVIEQKGGARTTVNLTHTARFHRDGHEITLLATHWKGGKPMFVIRDETSGKETYGASRFLIGEDAGEGTITLDFNRAFTPPCGFTDFAICPLPPRENILPFRVEAGELTP